ncbi:hypothetical protein LCGC14_0847550 [marine sediment metagenome]|uniref:Uncharacterized protein n=1 Tax=marine sediment metagenome TaxID=412755 RepID=A0A0F9PWI8_9ZZZZ
MKRSNKLSVAALSLYIGAWVVGLFGATGVSKALVVIAALVFMAAVVGYLISGLTFFIGAVKGDKVIAQGNRREKRRVDAVKPGFVGSAEQVAAHSHIDLDIDQGWNPPVNW